MDGCKHYRRKCKIISPCCDTEYWCRHCHNEDPENNHGDLNRFEIKEIVCSVCGERQPIGNSCINNGNISGKKCDVREFASYYCNICKLWDNEGIKKSIFHCDECGICRIGEAGSYFHCKICSMCYPISIKETHKCIENSCKRPCPLCLDDLFQSIKTVSILSCGHTIHEDCLSKLTELSGLVGMRCPICNKTLYESSEIWKAIDKMIEDSPLPESSIELVDILCSDCNRKSSTNSHPYGLKCQFCGSYNTRSE
ncbi:hypothetical protein RS030_81379 [Cryptosporidium xiaoi]|uniref:CHY zinc finger domain-containing protein n=1 Tax=Cryptosporidium xiaoi TaxID=659607 RepID=A0AAV9XYU6_9CRYT